MTAEITRALVAGALGALCMLSLVGFDRWRRERDAAARDAAKRDAGPPDPETDLTAAYMVGYQQGLDRRRDWCRRAAAVLERITKAVSSPQMHNDARALLDDLALDDQPGKGGPAA